MRIPTFAELDEMKSADRLHAGFAGESIPIRIHDVRVRIRGFLVTAIVGWDKWDGGHKRELTSVPLSVAAESGDRLGDRYRPINSIVICKRD